MDVGEENTSKAAKSSFKIAKKHLAKAIELDPHSLIYVQYTVSLLLHKERFAQCRTIIQQYCIQNPNDPSGLRLYTLLLNQHFPDDEEEFQNCLIRLMELDPVSDLGFKELFTLYKTEALPAQTTAEMIARRLEYLPNDILLWKKLWKVLKRDPSRPSLTRTRFWRHRKPWWATHFFSAEGIPGCDNGELLLRRRLCAQYILGEESQYCSEATKQLQRLGVPHDGGCEGLTEE